ncbi:MAG: UvrD-helicase domain-containing protein, partial [Clostridia bacterium]|nr:UvrD-helicase domain-containing protein [Clostridia bacterium]
MPTEFTNDQLIAIKKSTPMLVSAAAGSGKTAVLVERVIEKLTDPVNPISADKMLIVTFTNAAAAEMRARIEKRLFEECRKHPEDLNLLRQKHLIYSADICTIDSFCTKVIRQKFNLTAISHDIDIFDPAEHERLLAE